MKKNDFFQVELQSGETGWVDKKFIIFQPPNAVQLEQVRREKAALEARIEKLSQEIASQKENLTTTQTTHSNQLAPLQDTLKQVRSENKQIRQELNQAEKKYSTLLEQSKNIQQIVSENKELTRENKVLASQIKSLEGRSRNLFKTAMIKWFLAGVGVLLLGWLIGQSVSSKRRGYGSLLD